MQFAMKESEETQRIYSECRNISLLNDPRKDKLSVELYPKQKDFLDRAAKRHNLNGSEVSVSRITCRILSFKIQRFQSVCLVLSRLP